MTCKFQEWHILNSREYRKSNPDAPRKKRFEYKATMATNWICHKLIDKLRGHGKVFTLTYQQIANDLKNRTEIDLRPETIRKYISKLKNIGLLTTRQSYDDVVRFEILDSDGLKRYFLETDALIKQNKPSELQKQEKPKKRYSTDRDRNSTDLKRYSTDPIYLNTCLKSNLKSFNHGKTEIMEEKRETKSADTLENMAAAAVAQEFGKDADQTIFGRVLAQVKDAAHHTTIRNLGAYTRTVAKNVKREQELLCGTMAQESPKHREEAAQGECVQIMHQLEDHRGFLPGEQPVTNCHQSVTNCNQPKSVGRELDKIRDEITRQREEKERLERENGDSPCEKMPTGINPVATIMGRVILPRGK